MHALHVKTELKCVCVHLSGSLVLLNVFGSDLYPGEESGQWRCVQCLTLICPLPNCCQNMNVFLFSSLISRLNYSSHLRFEDQVTEFMQV